MLNCCKVGVIIGLFDVYGCGCIIGDYCCVVLYGVDFLMEEKMYDFNMMFIEMLEDVICLCEELLE